MKLMPFRLITMVVTLIAVGVYGQKQSKTFNEVFNVTAETVLDINTSNVDIEFETWDKSQIVVEATIEIEGASAEEAKAYFEKGAIEIVGNSKKVEITTGVENSWAFSYSMDAFKDINIDLPDFHFVMPEIPEIPEMAEFHFEMTDIPPVPPVPAIEFDYEAYGKDGEKYLKKWQKKFEKGFDKDYEKKMEEWSAKMEAKRAVMDKRREEMEIRRQEIMQQRMEVQEKRMEERAVQMEKRAAEMEKRMEEREQTRELVEKERYRNAKGANIFYYSNDGKNKNYKVKKTLKIKMPKGTKINMNVRHGEVKLAGSTMNLSAKLSYSVLVANIIDGDQTSIQTSYSPVSVEKWNYGLLQADYSEHVDLKEVLNLRLSTISSDVTIDRLLETVIINNKMGPLTINSIAKDFKEIDVSLQNAELNCNLPATDFLIEVNGTLSKFTAPTNLSLNHTKNNNNTVDKGFNIDKNSAKSILINSKYSEVVLKE